MITIFEKYIKSITLYRCKDFIIQINENNAFCMTSDFSDFSGILGMANLINENSQYLEDPKLREITLTDKFKNDDISYLELDKEKIKNIKKYRSGVMCHFWDDEYNEKLPIDIFMEKTLKYYPKISYAIEKSNNLGDIIDRFKLIHEELFDELEPIDFYIQATKYNL